MATNRISPLPMRAPAVSGFKSINTDLQVQMLGTFRIIAREVEINNLPGKKATSILAYLLYKYPRAVHREFLIEKFWPDSTSDSARNCLHVTLHAIRKSFEQIGLNDNIIRYQNECYGISDNLSVERDIELFESYWKKARRLDEGDETEEAINAYHQAFAFYRGDFMEQYPYEEWAEIGRERYRETWLVILDRLTSHFFSQKKYQICLNLCRRVLYKDPCLEEIHRRLMSCYLEMGMKDLAIRQYYKCQHALNSELSISPGKATIALYDRIRAA